MDEVASELYVGSIEDAGDQSLLERRRISVILSLTHTEPDPGFPSAVTVVRFPMLDGPRNDRETFARAVSEAVTRWEAGNRVLIHCSAGASRSPAVAAAAISLSTDRPVETAFRQLKQRRPAVDPHEALVRQAARVSSRGTDRIKQADSTQE